MRPSGPHDAWRMERRARLDGLIPEGSGTRVTRVASPPSAGTMTTSHQAFWLIVRP